MPFLCGVCCLVPAVAGAQQAQPQGQPATPAGDAAPATTAATPAAGEAAPSGSADAAGASASEEGATAAAANAPAATAASGDEAEDPEPAIELHGAVEAAYSFNFNRPSNNITDWRWYDTHHNTIGLQNVLLQTDWNAGPVKGHVQLQLGAFTELFWDAGRGPERDLLWRLMQEVTVEWRTPHRALSIEGGVFNVPFGPEYNVAYLNWNWSADNLFALMPYQIAGFRANYDLGRGRRVRLGVYNGWDQIVSDNNDAKSIMASFEWDNPDDEETYFYANYMVGDERDFGDARGPYARHTLDVYGQWHVLEWLTLRGHFFGGMAPTRGETIEGWVGGALFAKVAVHRWLSIAARGDVVHTFSGADGEDLFHADVLPDPTATTLMGSGTLTLDFHPTSHVSMRLEGRHDRANFARFYSGQVPQTMPMMGMGTPTDIHNDSSQTTVTLGMTAWF
ncbi:MAG: outer membrane beta-barrel protein [Polyangiales bacterium]